MKIHGKIQTKMYTIEYASPLGLMTMAGIETAEGSTALTGLWFQGQKYFGATLTADCETKILPVFEDTKRWLDLYFQGKVPDFTPPLSFETTSFRRAVWEILLTIPYGQTVTYGQIAGRIARQQGQPGMSAQAVGGAVGHNPISIIVPCHRVVGADCSLTGYAGGMEKKQWLLGMEEGVK